MTPLRFYYDRTQPRARAFANGSTNPPPSAWSASSLPSRSRTRMPFRMQPMCRLTRRLAEVVLPPSTPPCPRRHPSRHAPPRTRRRSSCCTPAAAACDSRRWQGMAPRGARAAADPDAAVVVRAAGAVSGSQRGGGLVRSGGY